MRRRIAGRLDADTYAQAFGEGSAWTLDDIFKVMRSGLPDVAGSQAEAVELEAAEADATPAEMQLRITSLGRFAMAHAGETVPELQLPTGKIRELLAYLLLHDGATKDEIGLALWPDASAAQLRNVFHVTMHHLRRHLGEQNWITFERGRYRLQRSLDGGACCVVDVDELTASARVMRQSVQRRAPVTDGQLDEWQQLLARCDGDFMPGSSGEEWLTAAQDRLRIQWSSALDDLLQLARAANRQEQVLALCELLVRRDPYRESAHRAYMEALGALGETARALAHYESLVVMLQRELGATPSVETRRVVELLRR